MRSDTPTKATILLVEDDADLRGEMARYLSSNDYAVREAADVPAARTALACGDVGLVVLDVNLPGEDGLSLCRNLAADGRSPPILMLSAMGEPIDRILGLELGADDYVVKPITPRELLARIKALLRRRPVEDGALRASAYRFAGFHLDMTTGRLRAPRGTVILLTRTELILLKALLDKPRMVTLRPALALLLNGDQSEGSSRAVDLHISRLRRKIEDHVEGELIRTQRGHGYMLDAQVTPE